MLCKQTSKSVYGWLWSIYKKSENAKTVKLYKRVRPSKNLGEKSCEIKGGGHEMMMIINFCNAQVSHY